MKKTIDSETLKYVLEEYCNGKTAEQYARCSTPYGLAMDFFCDAFTDSIYTATDIAALIFAKTHRNAVHRDVCEARHDYDLMMDQEYNQP
tara:strand:+ start:4160 stop:4429 length:270 start_codon:yes stop_codon:yes gene_type:complete